MITPRFEISQTDERLTIVIHAPYTDINGTEVHVDQDQVCFYSSPYYLRLHLPGPVVEDDHSRGSYDASNGEYTIIVSKANPGQHFEGLSMINALLNPSKVDQAAKIEVIELPDLLDLQSPDSVPASERPLLQLAAEDKTFNAEHYLADWAEESHLVLNLLQLEEPWTIQGEEFTMNEKEQMLRLPKRELLPLDKREARTALLGLAELIFCWAHEQRSSSGDPGPESARSVRRLSATFSWLRQFNTAKELVTSCVRRALCVPLYRNWNLAMKTLDDTQFILKKAIEKAKPHKSEIGWELEELELAGRLAMEEEESQELASHVRSKLCIKEGTGEDSDDCSSDNEGTDSSSGDYTCSSDVSGSMVPANV
ncbi:hypothetical protein B566_EDAN006493 [Ephemera danica]|nr:hypothetical protein B566_EDAN006493 [Ephemera danica]